MKTTIRRVAATLAAATIAVGGGLLVNPTPAAAHGALMVPGSRTYFCWVDGLQGGGDIRPQNPACADAVAQSGTGPLYNWFAVLDSNAAGRTVGYVPDGTICSAGDRSPYDFSPYNMARTDWPRTHLTSGGSIRMEYNDWAHHPGHWDLYVTRNGWNPNTPLSWSELESEPFFTIANPPQRSGGASGLSYYDFGDVQLPSGKSGLHIIVSHWVRSDSQENFYGCSDVVFDGGNGQVSGIGGAPGEPPVDPTTPPVDPTTPPVDPTTPPVDPTTPPVDPTTPPVEPGGDCSVDFGINDWGSGFQGDVTLTSASAVSSWTLEWDWPGNQQITQVWSADGGQSGSSVSVSNVSWNGSISAGGSVSFGFLGSGSGATPSAATLNGTACSVS